MEEEETRPLPPDQTPASELPRAPDVPRPESVAAPQEVPAGPPGPVPAPGEIVNPGPVAGKDVYEAGLIPVDEPIPPEVLAAQKTVADGEAAVAAGIKNVTDTSVLSALAKEGLTVEDLTKILKDSVAAQGAEIQALHQELQQVKTAGQDGLLSNEASVGGYPWMYWRLPNTHGFKTSGRAGWIQFAPGGATPKGARDAGSYSTYLRKGMVPVTKYGYINPPTKPQAFADSYVTILRAPGGAAEFPASQVIAYNWHVRPPIAGLKFAQYEALKGSIKNWVCEACGDQRFFMPNDKEIGGVYRTHLMVDHKYPFREAAEAVKHAGLTLTAYAQGTIQDAITKTSPDAD